MASGICNSKTLGRQKWSRTRSSTSKNRRELIDSSGPFLCARLCDLTEPLISDPTKTFFEPGCGEGNILAEVLNRRLKILLSSSPRSSQLPELILEAVSKIYGIDHDPHAVISTRRKLARLAESAVGETPDYRFIPNLTMILEKNILQADFLHPENIIFTEWHYESPYSFRAAKIFISGGEYA